MRRKTLLQSSLLRSALCSLIDLSCVRNSLPAGHGRGLLASDFCRNRSVVATHKPTSPPLYDSKSSPPLVLSAPAPCSNSVARCMTKPRQPGSSGSTLYLCRTYSFARPTKGARSCSVGIARRATCSSRPALLAGPAGITILACGTCPTALSRRRFSRARACSCC